MFFVKLYINFENMFVIALWNVHVMLYFKHAVKKYTNSVKISLCFQSLEYVDCVLYWGIGSSRKKKCCPSYGTKLQLMVRIPSLKFFSKFTLNWKANTYLGPIYGSNRSIRAPCMGQIYQFKNYSNSMEPCAKKFQNTLT